MSQCVNCRKELNSYDGYLLIKTKTEKVCDACKEKIVDAGKVREFKSTAEFTANEGRLRDLGATDMGILYLRNYVANRCCEKVDESLFTDPIQPEKEANAAPAFDYTPTYSGVADERSFWLKLYAVCTWLGFIAMLVASVVYAAQLEKFWVALVGIVVSFITVSLNMVIIEIADGIRYLKNKNN